MSGSIVKLLMMGLALLSFDCRGGRVLGQLGEIPPCDMERAQSCFEAGVNSAQPSGCNWYRIIPAMYACVDDAVAGCMYAEQTDWYSIVTSYNTSLQSDDCYPACTNQVSRELVMFSCFDVADFSNLARTITQSTTIDQSSSECSTLSQMDSCLKNSTTNCPALTDVTYDRINSTVGGKESYMKCGLASPKPATTIAPLYTLASQTPTPGTTSSSDKVDGTDLLIIILGSLLILATILVITVAICLACRRRREVRRRSILRDWRPNGHKVYRDEPQWIRQERIDFRAANEGGRVYSPNHREGRRTRERIDERDVREVYVNQGAVLHH